MQRSFSIPLWTGCYSNRMSPIPINTPGWRETKWSKDPRQGKQHKGRGLNPGSPDPEFEVLTARSHIIVTVYQFHLQVQKKGRYPILHPIPWHSCLDLYPALTTPMRWVWLKTFFSLVDFTWSLSGGSRGGTRPPTPLIFRPNWGPKVWIKVFWDPPPPTLPQGLDERPPPPPPYLKVWICSADYWLHAKNIED